MTSRSRTRKSIITSKICRSLLFTFFLHCTTSLFRLIFLLPTYSNIRKHWSTLDTMKSIVCEKIGNISNCTEHKLCVFFYRFRRRLFRFLFAFLCSPLFFSASSRSILFLEGIYEIFLMLVATILETHKNSFNFSTAAVHSALFVVNFYDGTWKFINDDMKFRNSLLHFVPFKFLVSFTHIFGLLAEDGRDYGEIFRFLHNLKGEGKKMSEFSFEIDGSRFSKFDAFTCSMLHW